MNKHIHQASSVHFTIFVLLCVFSNGCVECREWQQILDQDIVRKSDIDSSRYELQIEADPFFYPGDKVQNDNPTELPNTDTDKVWTTLSPTTSPSSLPSDAPSLVPTEWDIERNGGCRNGRMLYEVHMYDSWGDGWDDATLTISGITDQNPLAGELPNNSRTTTNTNAQGDMVVSISKTIDLDSLDRTAANSNQANEIYPLGMVFQGSLLRGSHDFAEVCLLPKRCYQTVVTGGEFLDEVSWDIRPGNLDDMSSPSMEPILFGGAPTGCTFSLPDEYGHHFCPNTCSESILADAMIKDTGTIDNLNLNENGIGVESLSQAMGRTYISDSKPEQLSQTTTFVTESSMQSRGDNAALSVLSKFKLVETGEHTNV